MTDDVEGYWLETLWWVILNVDLCLEVCAKFTVPREVLPDLVGLHALIGNMAQCIAIDSSLTIHCISIARAAFRSIKTLAREVSHRASIENLSRNISRRAHYA